jgi:hypothetical protein
MIFKILLTLSLGVVLLYSITQSRSSPVVALIASVAAAVGAYLVWIPDHANLIALRLGIGRGADLLLYCWVTISFTLLLNVHFKLKRQTEAITLLAREIALLEANLGPRPIRLP